MSTGRGGSSSSRGRKAGKGGSVDTQSSLEAPGDLANLDFSAPNASADTQQPTKQRRAPAKTVDELRRAMDIVQSRIVVIIDSLEGDENEASLKRNVATAVKHLKQINTLLN